MFRQAGHECVDVRDVGLGDAPDLAVANYDKSNTLAIVTRDSDFGDVRNYPPANFPGIVVVQLHDGATANELTTALRSFLQQEKLVAHMHGNLAILEPGRVRFRTE